MTTSSTPPEDSKVKAAREQAAREQLERAEQYQVTQRRRVVRRLMVEGMPEGEIVRLLTQGVTAEKNGPVIRVSEATVRRDLEAVGKEFRDLFSSQDALDLEITAAYARYKLIAVEAMSGPKPNYHAAIAATDRQVRIAASRSPTWRHLAGTLAPRAGDGGLPPLEEEDPILERAREIAAMDDLDLLKHHRRLQERARAMGLPVGKLTGEA